MELLELRKRTFELIAPLKFDCYRAEDLLEQLIATAQKKRRHRTEKNHRERRHPAPLSFLGIKGLPFKGKFQPADILGTPIVRFGFPATYLYGQLLYGIGISAPRQCPKTVRPASCFRVRYCPYPDVTKPVQLQPEIFSDVLKRLCHLPAVFQLSA